MVDSSDFWLRLQPLPSDVPAHVRLRLALKMLLRRFRFRALEVSDVTDKELDALVRRMRAAQKRYFQAKTMENLREARDLEQRVDDEHRRRDQGPGLYDECDEREGLP